MEMQGLKVKKYMDKLAVEKGLPLLDLSVWKENKPLFRYTAKGTGKELLYLYSATKPITVVCAMRLVEEGKLDLDDPVGKYLPAYNNLTVKDADGKIRPAQNTMTVRHLLTMTGGLNYDLYKPSVLALKEKGIDDTLSIVNAFASEPLMFDPGACFCYSLCHDVLGAVIEVVSGKRFSAYMKEIVFQPLEMHDSDFHLDKTRALAPQWHLRRKKINQI